MTAIKIRREKEEEEEEEEEDDNQSWGDKAEYIK